MDGCFLKLFLSTISPKQCGCLEKSLDTLKCEMIQSQSQVTFESIQTMLKSIPPDLRIICEDKIEFSSHKVLFGLMNTTLASIFLEDEFINEIVTLFIPTESRNLEAMLCDEFVLKRKLNEIFSTSLHCKAGSRDVIKYLNESRSIELIKAAGRHNFKEEEDESRETNMGNDEDEIMNYPVIISFKKHERKEKKLTQKSSHRDINSTQSSLTKHIKSMHEEARYVCDQCDYKTAQKGNLTTHIQVKHECVRYACDQCDYQATQQHHLKTHIQSKHEGVKYSCDKCGKQFTLETNLNAHIQSMHDSVKHFCGQCGKQFKSRSSLTHHIRSKHDGGKYVCDQCDYQAAVKGDLDIHIRVKHEGIKYSCEQCGKQFTQRTNLCTHIRLKHNSSKQLFKKNNNL